MLSSYIDPFDSTKSNSSDHSDNCLPDGVLNCLEESPLRSVLSNYLRNDSGMDLLVIQALCIVQIVVINTNCRQCANLNLM